jgi:hypothetical protein
MHCCYLEVLIKIFPVHAVKASVLGKQRYSSTHG